jgi:hypothetical protein
VAFERDEWLSELDGGLPERDGWLRIKMSD